MSLWTVWLYSHRMKWRIRIFSGNTNFVPKRLSKKLHFQVTAMIEWGQKLKLKEIPRASNKTSKNPWTQNLTPRPITQNICCFKRNILYRKTTSHSFEYPLKFILNSSHPKNYLLISGAHSPPRPPLKFLRSPPSFKIRGTPSPPNVQRVPSSMWARL